MGFRANGGLIVSHGMRHVKARSKSNHATSVLIEVQDEKGAFFQVLGGTQRTAQRPLYPLFVIPFSFVFNIQKSVRFVRSITLSSMIRSLKIHTLISFNFGLAAILLR